MTPKFRPAVDPMAAPPEGAAIGSIPDSFRPRIRFVRISTDIDRIRTNRAPLKSGDSQLFNGEGLVQIRSISAEIWPYEGSVTQNQTGRSVSVTLYARRYSNLRPSVAKTKTDRLHVLAYPAAC